MSTITPPKGQGWKSSKVKNGIRTIHCDSWNGFSSLVDQVLIDYDSYIFRGHAKSEWKLEPTIDRIKNSKIDKSIRIKHLEKFQHATRGRRGPNPKLPLSENDWWALGQHHGLLTPLLDWSESPFVSAYFAFLPELERKNDEDIVVYALSRTSCEQKNQEIRLALSEDVAELGEYIDFIRPLTDENPRLISQRGLFTRVPDHTDIEQWVEKNFPGENQSGARLIKIYIPSKERLTALKSLNRMNVNHLSLFPDLDGASKHCNTSLAIQKYG